MRYFSLVVLSLFIFACKGEKTNQPVPDSRQSEQNDGWVLLFDGESFEGWKTYLKDSIPEQWQIEQGTLVYTPDPDKDPGMNNLITKKQYSSFELSLEWKIEEDGNSGIFYWVQEDDKYVVPYLTAPEVQLRDYSSNQEFNDSKQMSGAIFGLVGPDKNYAKPAGEWNQLWIKIDVENNIGEVRLNGTALFTYPLYGEAWKALVSDSKFKDWEAFGAKQVGHIGLQDHAHKVWFKNIKIKEQNAMRGG